MDAMTQNYLIASKKREELGIAGSYMCGVAKGLIANAEILGCNLQGSVEALKEAVLKWEWANRPTEPCIECGGTGGKENNCEGCEGTGVC